VHPDPGRFDLDRWATDYTRSEIITLRFDGWMLPKAGVGFVWVLEREMALVGAA
jgi:hypothetical protein